MPLTLTPYPLGGFDLTEPYPLSQAGIFNVKDYGATGDGVTSDSAALQAAYDAIPSSGGVLLFPAGTYLGKFAMNSTKPVRLVGYGATLKVPANQTGIDVQTGNGMNDRKSSLIEGLLVDGQGGVGQQQGVTGIKITNSDWVKLRHVKVQKCVKGIHLLASGTGWCESTSIEGSALYECDTGLRFELAAGGTSGSFLQTGIRDLAINSCTLGIDTSGNNGAGLQRSMFENITIWLARVSDVGIRLGCAADGSVWKDIAFESTLATTAFDVTTNWDDKADISAHFNGGAPLIRAAVAAGLTFTYTLAHLKVQKVGAGAADTRALMGVSEQGDTVGRAYLASGANPGLNLGPGSGAADVALLRGAASRLDVWADLYHRGSKSGFYGTAPITKPTVTGAKAGNAALGSLLTQLAALGLITDSSTA